MQKTILSILLALIATTGWAQEKGKYRIYMERLFEGYAYRIRREGREVRDKRKRQSAHLFETHGTTGNRS